MILPSLLASLPWNGTRVGLTAAVERAHSDRARSGSKGSARVSFHPIHRAAFTSTKGSGLLPPASEVLLEGLSRARTSRYIDLNGCRGFGSEVGVGLEGKGIIRNGRCLVKQKILIIDDSVDSYQLLSTILQAHNFYPVWAADGIQAMAAARFHHPQAILLDLGLPGGDGFVVLERLKSNLLMSNIPVIVVTVRDRQEAEEKARRLGAADYVSKPVQVDALMASLQSVLATQDGVPAA